MNIEKMTAAQREAVTSEAKTLLVIAGPGSGKTTVLSERVNRLVREKGMDPRGMVLLTFTNAAARELEKRCIYADQRDETGKSTMLGVMQPPFGYCGTLHGYALKMLKEHGSGLGYGDKTTVVSPEISQQLLETKARSLGWKKSMEPLFVLKQDWVLRPKGRTRQIPSPAELIVQGFLDDMHRDHMVDFDMILDAFHTLVTYQLAPHDWATHLFDDECQDHSAIDWEILRGLPIPNKTFVGDPDQAIYGFRGGSVQGIIDQVNMPGTHVVKLEGNFRCGVNICTAANQLISHNQKRVPKETISMVPYPGIVIHPMSPLETEGDEVNMIRTLIRNSISQTTPEERIKPEEIAILARTNAVARNFVGPLEAAGIPVKKKQVSGLPLDWPLCTAFWSFASNPSNDTLCQFFMVEKEVKRGISRAIAIKDAARERRAAESAGVPLSSHARLYFTPTAILGFLMDRARLHGVSRESLMIVSEVADSLANPDAAQIALALGAVAEKTTEEGEGVECLTIHAAKGREWDVVFLAGFEDGIIPSRRSEDTANGIEEERRLAYVGLTRARKFVVISHANTRVQPWFPHKIVPAKESRFLKEIIAQ